MSYYRCSCCGSGYRLNKPQDPERDTGWGFCFSCKHHMIADWVKYGHAGKDQTPEQAEARFALYHQNEPLREHCESEGV